MFRSGISSFLKAGMLSDTACLEDRHFQERPFVSLGDDIDLENFAFSDDDVPSLASDDGDNLLDEMDEEREENEDEGEEDTEGGR